jgi:hypothetical protein
MNTNSKTNTKPPRRLTLIQKIELGVALSFTAVALIGICLGYYQHILTALMGCIAGATILFWEEA